MTGIVNVTGARSGVIGTTVGTPAGTPDPSADGWWGYRSTDFSSGSIVVMDIDTWSESTGRAFLGSNVSESAGRITVGTAGWYVIGFRASVAGVSTVAQLCAFNIDGVLMAETFSCIIGGTDNFNMPIGTHQILVELTATSYVEIKAQGAFEGGRGTDIEDATTYFWGWRISD